MDKKIIVKVPGGKLLKLFVSFENSVIEKVQITGDFFAYPEEAIAQLESLLTNHVLDQAALERTITDFVDTHNVSFFGITIDALVAAIMQCSADAALAHGEGGLE